MLEQAVSTEKASDLQEVAPRPAANWHEQMLRGLLITLLIVLASTFVALQVELAIVNRDISRVGQDGLLAPTLDLDNWRFFVQHPDIAYLSVEGDVIRADIGIVDGKDKDIQLGQRGIDLQKGQIYRLAFQAKTNADRPMEIEGMLDQPDYHNLGMQQVAQLTPDWQGFTYTFTALGVLRNESRVPNFILGNQTGSVWLRKISLTPSVVTSGSGPNLLTQPTDQPVNWRLETGGKGQNKLPGTMASDGGALRVTATKVDGTDWHVQCFQSDIRLQDNTAYTISLNARADQPRSALIYASVDDPDYHQIGLHQYINLDTAWRSFQFTFITHGIQNEPVRVPALAIGNHTGAIWISNVRLATARIN